MSRLGFYKLTYVIFVLTLGKYLILSYQGNELWDRLVWREAEHEGIFQNSPIIDTLSGGHESPPPSPTFSEWRVCCICLFTEKLASLLTFGTFALCIIRFFRFIYSRLNRMKRRKFKVFRICKSWYWVPQTNHLSSPFERFRDSNFRFKTNQR